MTLWCSTNLRVSSHLLLAAWLKCVPQVYGNALPLKNFHKGCYVTFALLTASLNSFLDFWLTVLSCDSTGKYMQMMSILKPIAFDVIHCVSQLFDYYLYAVYTFFGRNDMVQSFCMVLADQLPPPHKIQTHFNTYSNAFIPICPTKSNMYITLCVCLSAPYFPLCSYIMFFLVR